MIRQLQREIRLYRVRYIRRPARKQRPSALFDLLGKDICRCILELGLVSAAKEAHEYDILRLQDRIAFELPEPVAVRLL